MDKYLSSFREMVSLRGLTDHTIASYSTYISAYLQYLSDNGPTAPEDASWQQMRDFIFWVQNTRNLSDRTINACISQLRFFTLYVLHKPWDPYQLPFRKFDSYTPFIPSREEMKTFLFSISDIKFKAILCLMFSSGLTLNIPENVFIYVLPRTALTVTCLFLITSGNSSSGTGIHFRLVPGRKTGSFHRRKNRTDPSITSVSPALSLHTKKNSDGSTVLPVTHSAMLLPPTIMKTEPTCSL